MVDHNYSSDSCPGDWVKTQGDRCWRNNPDSGGGASSAVFNTQGFAFTEVQAELTAQQHASMDAFRTSIGIDDYYVDGLSLTLGQTAGSREHLYTWAVGLYQSSTTSHSCPGIGGNQPSSFVGADYFCQSGISGSSWNTQWYSDVLFSSDLASIDLGVKSVEVIEARLMSDQESNNEDIGVRTFKLLIR